MVKVSVIIPMKNEENNIRLCLDSIVGNSYPKEQYEIICVDNGSTDKTVEMARRYTENIYLLPDKTISHMRNYGAHKARGEYLAFVDADCIVDKYWMESASHYFGSDGIVCFGSTPEIPADATWVQEAWYLNKEGRKDVQRVDWLESMNLFVKKDVFIEIDGFNEKLETCEDVDLCYRIGQKYQIISDKKIKAVHLGEARTLKEFIRKELWRGKSNMQGVKEHGLKLKEIPSIILPLYYLALPVVFFVLLYSHGLFITIISSLMLIILPPLLISIYITSRLSKYSYIIKAFFIYLVYFLVRAISMII